MIAQNMSSRMILRTAWENGTLSVWLKWYGRQDHFDVPESVYRAFLGTRMKGEFYTDHIRDRF